MALVVACPVPKLQFPLAPGGSLFTYAGGTTTKTTTYTDSTGLVPNTNPIILDLSGQPPAGVFIPPSTNIKFVLAPAGSSDPPTAPLWTVDNVAGPTTAAGTMALQNANAVAITDGSISVDTLACDGATTLSTLAVSGFADLDGPVNVLGAAAFSSTAVFSGVVTINANVNINASILSFGSTSGSASLEIQALSTGFGATVLLQTGSSSRWAFYKNTVSESGSNVGSDLQIDAYADSGALNFTAMKITRSSGLVTIGSLLVNTNNGLTLSSQVTGAGSGMVTSLTNLPHTAQPAFWCPIVINGSNYFFPCWAA